MLIQATDFLEAMVDNNWFFPTAECIHIASLALSVGTIALVDFSLLGIGLQRRTAPQLVRSTELWTLSGLVLIIFSGLMLFASDPDHYYLNLDFQFKMTCLVLAIAFNYTIHRKVALSEAGSGMSGKVVAGISLVLWITIIFSGLLFAFVPE